MKANPKGVGRPVPREELPAPPTFDRLVMICSAEGWSYVYHDPVAGLASRPVAVWGLFEAAGGRRYIRGLGPEFAQVAPEEAKFDPRMSFPFEYVVTNAPKSVP